MSNYRLSLPEGPLRSITRLWLILAIAALAAAGLFSLPPVILRGPQFSKLFDIEQVFATTLVVHVDLSVLIWMLSIGGLLWSLLADGRHVGVLRSIVILAMVGAGLIAIAPFMGSAHPVKNNYIPVLQNLTFFLGLSLFGCAILFQCAMTVMRHCALSKGPLYIGTYGAAVISLVAFACFFLSERMLPDFYSVGPEHFYEMLFWGGGHVLQFTYTTLALIAWLWMADACQMAPKWSPKIIQGFLALNVVCVIGLPGIYLMAESLEDTVAFFSWHMRAFAGISAFGIGLSIILAWKAAPRVEAALKPVKAALILSILMFGYGGLLGYLISGTNVTIPAHYHGSIVAITLAFMGLAYYLLPRLGFGELTGKSVRFQPFIYAAGQAMHITGLAWMGGYGALRKAPGTSQTIDTLAGKALFFSGGAIAIIGGLWFVVLALSALLKKSK